MELKTFNPQNELTSSYTNEHFIISKLLGLLFNKTVTGSKHIKRIEYCYNYSDKQNITFIFNNGYKQVFTNIPTSGGLLDDAGIEQILKNYKEVK